VKHAAVAKVQVVRQSTVNEGFSTIEPSGRAESILRQVHFFIDPWRDSPSRQTDTSDPFPIFASQRPAAVLVASESREVCSGRRGDLIVKSDPCPFS